MTSNRRIVIFWPVLRRGILVVCVSLGGNVTAHCCCVAERVLRLFYPVE